MMRAVFHHPCGPWLQERIAGLQSDTLNIDIVPDAAGAELERSLADAEILLHVLHPVTDEMMAAAPGLKLVQKIGVGLDAIDLDAAKARNIAVCNMPGTNTQAVVELTLGLMLSVLRAIPALDRQLQQQRQWSLPLSAQAKFGEISGKAVGLVGYGKVAQRLAIVLEALGAEVLINTRGPVSPAIGSWVEKNELLEKADIISLHIPETPDTRHWFDANAFARLKPGAILVNTARGALIDEIAMADALHSGRLAGAGLDVFANEPLSANDPVLSAPNIIATPHIAWLTRETLQRSLTAAIDNINRLASGKDLHNRHV